MLSSSNYDQSDDGSTFQLFLFLKWLAAGCGAVITFRFGKYIGKKLLDSHAEFVAFVLLTKLTVDDLRQDPKERENYAILLEKYRDILKKRDQLDKCCYKLFQARFSEVTVENCPRNMGHDADHFFDLFSHYEISNQQIYEIFVVRYLFSYQKKELQKTIRRNICDKAEKIFSLKEQEEFYNLLLSKFPNPDHRAYQRDYDFLKDKLRLLKEKIAHLKVEPQITPSIPVPTPQVQSSSEPSVTTATKKRESSSPSSPYIELKLSEPLAKAWEWPERKFQLPRAAIAPIVPASCEPEPELIVAEELPLPGSPLQRLEAPRVSNNFNGFFGGATGVEVSPALFKQVMAVDSKGMVEDFLNNGGKLVGSSAFQIVHRHFNPRDQLQFLLKDIDLVAPTQTNAFPTAMRYGFEASRYPGQYEAELKAPNAAISCQLTITDEKSSNSIPLSMCEILKARDGRFFVKNVDAALAADIRNGIFRISLPKDLNETHFTMRTVKWLTRVVIPGPYRLAEESKSVITPPVLTPYFQKIYQADSSQFVLEMARFISSQVELIKDLPQPAHQAKLYEYAKPVMSSFFVTLLQQAKMREDLASSWADKLINALKKNQISTLGRGQSHSDYLSALFEKYGFAAGTTCLKSLHKTRPVLM